MIRTARLLLVAAIAAGTVVSATAQSTNPKLAHQLSRIDFGIGGIGQFNSKVTGVVPPNGPVLGNIGDTITETESAGNTVGAMAAIRYTAKPYFGIEYNYTYARYTETFTGHNQDGVAVAIPPGQIQTGINENSLGYLITPPHQFFGLQPVIAVGAGSTRFRPTRGGGQGAPIQWRATYYYSVGVQRELGDSHFGVRVAFREAFFKAPDFLLNYLTINQHTHTIEPNFGFYLRF